MLILATSNKDRAHRIPRAYQTTQPVEDWLNEEEIRAILAGYFAQVNIDTCIWYFPNRFVDAVFKRLCYPFHIGLEQRLLKSTCLGGHLVVTAFCRDENKKL